MTDTCWKAPRYYFSRKDGNWYKTRRVVWTILRGPVGQARLYGCCVNPEHLKRIPTKKPLGGEQSPLAKMKGIDVLAARAVYAEGQTTFRELAEHYNISTIGMYKLIKGESWQSLPNACVGRRKWVRKIKQRKRG